MKDRRNFIIENLEKKSNAIFGFIVIQSILLAEKLSSDEFVRKIDEVKGLYMFIFIMHLIIVILGVIFLLMIDKRISKDLDLELKKAIQPHFTLAVKILVALLFGSIPTYVFLHHLFS